ncbi:MAG TPA: hypothetical protein VNU97_17170 [Rhizomicrobium sp.]|jgi:hypothetical protein|nr:hypothetical protein [Rhizomicrobium sp.]
MPNDLDNRRRAFAEAVTVEAWHGDFSTGDGKVDLHADVVFGTARVGGEAQSPVRFKLRIRQADVVVVIPNSEPVVVDTPSVSRDAPEFRAHLTETVQQSARLYAIGQASASASPKGVGASLTGSVSAERGVGREAKVEVTGEMAVMAVTQSKTSDGAYRWTIESVVDRHLIGRPWDAANAPRLKLIDQRKDRTKGIPPTVRVEVRCRREDIEIDEITLKDEPFWGKARAALGYGNRIAAAESYIRDQLIKEGLEVDNIADAFGQLTLASTTAEEIID